MASSSSSTRWSRVKAAWLCLAAFAAVPCFGRTAKPVDGAFFIRLSPESAMGTGGSGILGRGAEDEHKLFHKRAAGLEGLEYTVRHEFTNRDIYLGLSVNVVASPLVGGVVVGRDASSSSSSLMDTMELLKSIPGVVEVAPVYEVHIPDHPVNETQSTLNSFTAYNDNVLFDVPEGPRILDTPLRMAGVDKVHAMGIKGKGVRVGIIDTGIDYRHPALGGGFGPGKKVGGGYAWIDDRGRIGEKKDPLATCFGGGHGTHVAGIVGMNPLGAPDGLPVSGVAPEAEIYMYRIFDCNLYAPGTDYIVAAMMRGIQDKVDMLSLSLSVGSPPATGLGDPLAEIVKRVTDNGIAVIVAMANDAGPSPFARNIYTQEFPSTEPTAIGVGAVSNADFPLVYTAQDAQGGNVQYASIWPVRDKTMEVVRVPSGCVASSWRTVVGTVNAAQLNNTLFAFEVTENCRAPDATNAAGKLLPPFVLGYSAGSRNPYALPYNLPPQSRLGTTQFIQLDVEDGDKLRAGLAAAAGTTAKYTLKFPADGGQFTSKPQNVGGMMDYYSSFGPVRLSYALKPQISAPGGNILSTWPVGTLGGYGILSGTSMATPFLAGCYALIKSHLPQAPMSEILTLMQTTAKPMAWVFDEKILSATAQQGAGLVDVYRAITSTTRLSPGQLLVTDNSKTVFGAANITVSNTSPSVTKTFVLGHRGAGFMNQILDANEYNQQARYGSASFAATNTLTLAPGQTTTVALSILPPADGVAPEKLPVFGGYVTVTDAASGEVFGVPYSGPPYSLYRTISLARVRQQAASASAPGDNSVAPSQPPRPGIVDPWTVVVPESLPSVMFYYPNGTGAALGDRVLSVNNSMRWASTARFNLWTTAYRVDVLPANTSLVPTHYGFLSASSGGIVPGSSVTKPPMPGADAAAAVGAAAAPPPLKGLNFVGVPSYGTLKNMTGLLSPSNNFSPNGRGGIDVTDADRKTVRLGAGDYRVCVGVMRWGGDKDVAEDWETWLSGVVRVVDGPAF